MANYIDGFVFPVPGDRVDEYQRIAVQVAEIWKEHGALEYLEFVGDDMKLEGTRSFLDAVVANEHEVVIFGWVVFPNREIRDAANKSVPEDPRMAELIGPLVEPGSPIFDASRMVYGGFKALV